MSTGTRSGTGAVTTGSPADHQRRVMGNIPAAAAAVGAVQLDHPPEVDDGRRTRNWDQQAVCNRVVVRWPSGPRRRRITTTTIIRITNHRPPVQDTISRRCITRTQQSRTSVQRAMIITMILRPRLRGITRRTGARQRDEAEEELVMR